MADWNENARQILAARYLARDKQGNLIETPDQMLERVAKAVSFGEKTEYLQREYYEKFLGLMDSLEFLPNSPALINAGRELGQLAACFVLPIPDNIEGIFEMVKQSALIHKSGGGTGFNFSSLRPEGSLVGSTQGVASGPISFMSCFDKVTETVKQGGVRRGANMGILNISHTDIMKFIECKNGNNEFQNFNLSVALDGEFLSAVKNNGDIQLAFHGLSHRVEIKAVDIFNRLCENAWSAGEPGVLFMDTINKANPTPWLGRIFATNPCVTGDTLIAVADGRIAVSIKQLAEEGVDIPVFCMDERNTKQIRIGRRPRLTQHKAEVFEIVLSDGSTIKTTSNHQVYVNSPKGGFCVKEVSALGILDKLIGFVNYKKGFPKLPLKARGIQFFNVNSVKKAGEEGVYNITVDEYHNYCIVGKDREDWTPLFVSKNCGEAPLLSWESCNLGSIDISKFVTEKKKIDFDGLRGVVQLSVRFLDDVVEVNKYPRIQIARKSRLTRKVGLGVMGWADTLAKMEIEYDSPEALNLAEKVIKAMRDAAYLASRELGKEKGFCFKSLKRRNACLITIAPTGTLSILAGCSNGIEPIFSRSYTRDLVNGMKLEFGTEYNVKTALEISPENHVRMQAAFQKYTDQAVSKTINLPETASVEDVKNAFLLAYELGCIPQGNFICGKNNKDIKDVRVGDEVVGHDGLLHQVVKKYERNYDGELFKITSAYNRIPLYLTPEHPLLVAKNRNVWVEAKNIRKNDMLVMPVQKALSTKCLLDVSQYLKAETINIEGNLIQRVNSHFLSNRFTTKKWKVVNRNGMSKPIPRYIELSPEFMKLLGYFIAEGHISGGRVHYTFSSKESNCIEEVVNCSKKLFPMITVFQEDRGSAHRIIIGSSLLAELFGKLCGERSNVKHFPEWFRELSIELLENLYLSYWNGDKGVTISHSLALDLIQVIAILGGIPQIKSKYTVCDVSSSKRDRDNRRNKCSFDSAHRNIRFRVSDIEIVTFSGKVYNLEVENSNSYLLEGLSVHNCKGLTVYRQGTREAPYQEISECSSDKCLV